jgi:hypothetical protein
MKTHKAITSLSQLKPVHVTKWLKLMENFKEEKYNAILENLQFRVQVVSIFLDMSLSQARRIDVSDLMDISEHYIKLMASFQYRDPDCKVIVNGREYVASKNYGAWSTGQIIDVKILKEEDFYLHPERFLAIMFVESDLSYCEEDKRGAIINPNSEREKIFKDHFPGDELWRFYAFFLRNYSNWRLAIMGIQTARTMIQTKAMAKELKRRQREMNLKSGIFSPQRFTIWLKTLINKLRK